jgi:hypothetical protein
VAGAAHPAPRSIYFLHSRHSASCSRSFVLKQCLLLPVLLVPLARSICVPQGRHSAVCSRSICLDESICFPRGRCSAACSRSLVLKQCLSLPVPLWIEVLHLMGGEYGVTAARAEADRAAGDV